MKRAIEMCFVHVLIPTVSKIIMYCRHVLIKEKKISEVHVVENTLIFNEENYKHSC